MLITEQEPIYMFVIHCTYDMSLNHVTCIAIRWQFVTQYIQRVFLSCGQVSSQIIVLLILLVLSRFCLIVMGV